MKKLLSILPLLLLSVACQNKGGSDSSTAAAVHQYGYVNGGTCYDYTTSTPVAPSYCQNGSYYFNNGTCYSSNGQPVNSSYCSTGNLTTASSQCYGTYIYNNYGNAQYVSCSGANCRGYTLIEASTGRQVMCQ